MVKHGTSHFGVVQEAEVSGSALFDAFLYEVLPGSVSCLAEKLWQRGAALECIRLEIPSTYLQGIQSCRKPFVPDSHHALPSCSVLPFVLVL